MQEPAKDPGRKRQRRKADRPTEIIAAAMRLWAERGFSATRLEDVATGAGVAKGTIYLYFPSKEALFEAALKDRLVATMDRASDMAAAFDGPTEALLLRFFETVQAQLIDGGAVIFLKVLIAEGHRFPDLTAAYEAVVLRRGMGAIRAILLRGVARGELRPGSEDTDPRLIMAPVMMVALWGTVFAGSSLPFASESLRQHVAIVMGGLRRR